MITINLKAETNPKAIRKQREKEKRESQRFREKFLSSLEGRLAEDPTNAELYCDMGESLLQDELASDASPAQYFEIAMHMDPKCGRAYLGLADYMARFRYIDNEDETKAKRLEFLKKGVKLCPEGWHKLWNFVKETTGSEKDAYYAAMEALEGNINSCYEEVHRQFWEFRTGSGRTLLRNNNFEEAMEFYRRAYERNLSFNRKLFVGFLRHVYERERSVWDNIYGEDDFRKVIDDELRQCEERARQRERKPEEPKQQRRVAKKDDGGLNKLGKMLLEDDCGDEERRERIAKFEAGAASLEEHLGQSCFDSNAAWTLAGYLASSWIPESADFAEDKIKELIWRFPSEPSLYVNYARFLINFSQPEAVEQLLIAVEELDFTPPCTILEEREGSRLHRMNEMTGMHHYAKGNFGNAAIAFEKKFKEDFLPQAIREESEVRYSLNENIEKLSAGDFGEGGNQPAEQLAGEIRKICPQLYEIYKARAVVKGKKLADDASAEPMPRPIAEKIEAIKCAREENCIYIEARELCLIGLYDEALQALDRIKDKGAAEHMVAGDVYESKWRKTGNAEFLGKAHDEYASAARHDPKDVECIIKLARTAKRLGKQDEVAGLWSIARKIGAKPDQIARLERLVGNRMYIRVLEANEEPDLGRRIDTLKAIDKECPGYASPSIATAYRELAPVVIKRMRGLLIGV